MNIELAKLGGGAADMDSSFEDCMITNDQEAMKRVEEVGDMQAEDHFDVYQRMHSGDFKKFYLESVVPISKGLSLKNIMRCNFFKKSELLFPVKISLDRLTFRHSDSSINMVIQYPNLLMRYFRYVDIILVGRYVIKNINKLGKNSSLSNMASMTESTKQLQKMESNGGETDDIQSPGRKNMKNPIMIFGGGSSNRKGSSKLSSSRNIDKGKVPNSQKTQFTTTAGTKNRRKGSARKTFKPFKTITNSVRFMNYKKRFTRFAGKKKTRKVGSKSVVIGNFDNKSGNDVSSKASVYTSTRSRSGSVLVHSSESIKMNNIVADDIENKENQQFYDYLSNNYTTID